MGFKPWLTLITTIVCLAGFGTGCQHLVSETVRQQSKPPLAFAQLRQQPEAYAGRVVILGGDILLTTNKKDTTWLEILQKPLDPYEVPRQTDATGGRFIVTCPGYLDPAIYTKGRRATFAGKVLGKHNGQIGERPYTYPLISCLEHHLLPKDEPVVVYHTYDDLFPFWFFGPLYYHHYHPYYRKRVR